MIYDYNGSSLSCVKRYDAVVMPAAYSVDGDTVFPTPPNIQPISLYGAISPAPSPHTQGGAVYGNTLVIAQASTDGQTVLAIYDLTTGNRIGQASLASASVIYHGNTLAFTNELHTGNNDFPYLYIGEYYGYGSVGVFDLSVDNGTYTATEIQNIDFSGVSGNLIGYGYSDFMLDCDRGKLMLVRYKTAGTYQAVAGNTMIISVYDLPVVSSGITALSDTDIITHYEITELIFARQETVYHRGYAYILSGGWANGKIHIVDCSSQTLCGVADIGGTVVYEPETMYFIGEHLFVIDTNNIYIFDY